MRKKILAIVLALVLVAALVPATALAAANSATNWGKSSLVTGIKVNNVAIEPSNPNNMGTTEPFDGAAVVASLSSVKIEVEADGATVSYEALAAPLTYNVLKGNVIQQLKSTTDGWTSLSATEINVTGKTHVYIKVEKTSTVEYFYITFTQSDDVAPVVTNTAELAKALGVQGYSNGPIKLTSAVELKKIVTLVGFTATIDLNGQTITGKDASGVFDVKSSGSQSEGNMVGSNLTITDTSSAGKKGTITSEESSKIFNVGSSTLTLDGGITVSSTKTGSDPVINAVGIDNSKNPNPASIIIKDANVTATAGGKAINGDSTTALAISKGTVTGAVDGLLNKEKSSIAEGVVFSEWGSTLGQILSSDLVADKGTDGKYTIKKATDVEAQVTVNGRTQKGSLQTIFDANKGIEITVLRNASLNLGSFGNDALNTYNTANTLTLILSEGVTEVKLSGTVKVAKIVVKNAASASVITSTVTAAPAEDQTTYTVAQGAYDAGTKTYTITSTRTLTEEEKGLTEVATITEVIDGKTTTRKVSLSELMTIPKTVTKITFEKDVKLGYKKNAQSKTEDVAVVLDIPAGADITIDLNGHTVEALPGQIAVKSMQGGKVTIADSGSAKGSLKASNKAGDPTAYGYALYLGGAVANSNGIAVIDTGAKVEGTVAVMNDSELTVKGTIAIASATDAAITSNVSSESGSKVTVENGGVVSNTSGVAVYMPQNGNLTVKEGGKVTGNSGVLARDGEVVVDGGTVEATGEGQPAIKVEKNDNYGADDRPTASVEVKSGTVKAAEGADPLAYEDSTEAGKNLSEAEKNAAAGEQIEVKGGNFSASVPTEYLAPELKYENHKNSGDAPYSYSSENSTDSGVTSTALARLTEYGFIASNDSGDKAGSLYATYDANGVEGTFTVEFSKDGQTVNGTKTGDNPTYVKLTTPEEGEYVVTLKKGEDTVDSRTIKVYKVSYVGDTTTVAIVSGDSVDVYVGEDGLDAALKAHPEGFKFIGGASMWSENGKPKINGYVYTVTLSAYTYVAPPMPGTPTGPDNPDNPDNPPVVDPAKQFVDVPDVAANKWYRDALNYVLTEKPGVIEGTDRTHFSPNAKLTRAAFAKILWALSGSEEPTTANPFTDVKSGDWFYKAVIWANAEGIMLGDAGRCKPEDNITREEMAVMIQRWLNKDGKAAAASKFTDAKDIHDWAAGAVNWAAEQGYIKGKDNGTFAPLATLTRAEMIVVVARTQGWIG